MTRFVVSVIVAGTGQIQHVVLATSEKAARRRITRAYPNRDIVFLSISD